MDMKIEERFLLCFKWLVVRKWINGLYFAIYLLYKLYHESYKYFENEKYLNFNLKTKKNWWTKLNKYHHFGENVTRTSDTRCWNKVELYNSKISKNETLFQPPVWAGECLRWYHWNYSLLWKATSMILT